MYAEIVIDIKSSQVDRPFTYRIPEELRERAVSGVRVRVPFGAGGRLREGYIIGLRENLPEGLPDEKVKEIDSVVERGIDVSEQLKELAIRIRERYGGTLYQSLSLVLPNKLKVTPKRERYFVYTGTEEELPQLIAAAEHKKHYAKLRLLTAFQEEKVLPASIVTDRLSIPGATLKAFRNAGLLEIRTDDDPEGRKRAAEELLSRQESRKKILNEEQEIAVEGILSEKRAVSLLFGITGSGKTEVYLELIERVLREGKEAIVLIPEIALTYQTVMRFYERFGDLVSVVHSRLSKGDKCERFMKAEAGEIRVMIGPRSALFTPFKHTGLIIIDEFHEGSFVSEQVPKYDTVETAVMRAGICGAKVVLGSATPSVEAYAKALSGEYALFRLNSRAVKGSVLPEVRIVDMRRELQEKNRSIFSRVLQEKIRDRLEKQEQVMLFLNRRGYSGAVSCRSCGEPLSCPHCSVAMKLHRDGSLHCHICGYQAAMPKKCPHCGSPLLGAFGTGTEKVEELALEAFPGARILRMDADTTKGKDGHRGILERFLHHEADILVGTQMIVKGHDFPNVTLVGILAADLSLNVPDYRSAERTFQLLTQAEGRAGRASRPGECIVQTYLPEHYAVTSAAAQDYMSFYRQEMTFRRQMKYPPCASFGGLMISGADQKKTEDAIRKIAEEAARRTPVPVRFLGPTEMSIYKVKDMYRQILYFKTADAESRLAVKRTLEEICEKITENERLFYSFEQ
ncbi:MAG: primosomal protein N' [Lachnospiraceae bacterium]|nr:primosomal protein N' [Lachnospiraceae bacterium]